MVRQSIRVITQLKSTKLCNPYCELKWIKCRITLKNRPKNRIFAHDIHFKPKWSLTVTECTTSLANTKYSYFFEKWNSWAKCPAVHEIFFLEMCAKVRNILTYETKQKMVNEKEWNGVEMWKKENVPFIFTISQFPCFISILC